MLIVRGGKSRTTKVVLKLILARVCVCVDLLCQVLDTEQGGIFMNEDIHDEFELNAVPPPERGSHHPDIHTAGDAVGDPFSHSHTHAVEPRCEGEQVHCDRAKEIIETHAPTYIHTHLGSGVLVGSDHYSCNEYSQTHTPRTHTHAEKITLPLGVSATTHHNCVKEHIQTVLNCDELHGQKMSKQTCSPDNSYQASDAALLVPDHTQTPSYVTNSVGVRRTHTLTRQMNAASEKFASYTSTELYKQDLGSHGGRINTPSELVHSALTESMTASQNRAEDLCVCEYTTLHAYHFGVCVCAYAETIKDAFHCGNFLS